MREEEKAIRNFIIMLIIVVVAVFGLYFATKYVVNKDEKTSETETKDVTVDYGVAIVGNMLSKTESEYYVLIYNSNDSNSYNYQTAKTTYSSKENSLAVYTVDLSNPLNSKYYSETETNTKADNINDLKFGTITLLKVKNGKITNSYETMDAINKAWKLN